MRVAILAALLPLTALAACAGSGRPNAESVQLDGIRKACEARGGNVVPSGRLTGEVALDNPCVIRGGGVAIPPGQ